MPIEYRFGETEFCVPDRIGPVYGGLQSVNV